MPIRTQIIDVLRKPQKCPVCGGEIVDIIYETGDLTEAEYFLWYRKPGIMGGDNIPRRPPIWACSCGCKRFRKVLPDGSDAPVIVKKLGRMRQAPATTINWQSKGVREAFEAGERFTPHTYLVDIVTELEESETFKATALNESDAARTIQEVVENGHSGLAGEACIIKEIRKIE